MEIAAIYTVNRYFQRVGRKISTGNLEWAWRWRETGPTETDFFCGKLMTVRADEKKEEEEEMCPALGGYQHQWNSAKRFLVARFLPTHEVPFPLSAILDIFNFQMLVYRYLT